MNAETNGWSPVTDEWAGSAYIVAGAIFDHLAEYDDHDVPQPYLAESITSNSTFTEWTIKMRAGRDLPGRREVRRAGRGRQLQRPARLGAHRRRCSRPSPA